MSSRVLRQLGSGRLGGADVFVKKEIGSASADIANDFWEKIGDLRGSIGITGTTSALEAKLYSLWKFDEVSGNAVDVKSRCNLVNYGAAQNQAGKLGTAFVFDGTDYLGNVDTIYEFANALSIGVWIKTTSTGTYKALVANFIDGAYGAGYDLMINDTNHIEWSVRQEGIAGTYANSTTNVCDGNWHHIVATFDGTYAKVYVDGSLEGTSSAWANSITYNAASTFQIGRRQDDLLFIGTIDQPEIYNSAITQSDVTELYNAGAGKSYPYSTAPVTVSGAISNRVVAAGAIAGSLSTTSVVAGAIRAKGKLSTSAAGVAVPSGVIRAKGKLSSVCAGIASVSGVIKAKGKLVTITSGSNSITGVIRGFGRIVAQAASVAVLTGNIHNVVAPASPIAGHSDSVTTVSATIGAKGKLLTQSTGVANVSGVIKAKGKLAGSSAGIAVDTGVIRAKGKLTTQSTGVSSVSAGLQAKGKLYGSCAGVSTDVGTIKGKGRLLGQSSSVTSVTGSLKTKGSLVGQTNGVTSVVGTTRAKGKLYASLNGGTTLSGSMRKIARLAGTINTGGSTGVASPLDAMLVSLWKLEESSGSAVDVKGVASLPLFGGVTRGAAGKLGNCFTFNGTTGYLGDIDTIYEYANALGISVWVKTSTTGVYQSLISNMIDGAYGAGFDLMVNDSGHVEWSVRQEGIASATAFGTTNICNGAWHHLVATFDGSYARIYVDNTLEGTSSLWQHSIVYSIDSRFQIGARQTDLFFNGSIDQPEIYNAALSQANVTDLYNGGSGKAYPYTTLLPAVTGNLTNHIRRDLAGVVAGVSTISGTIHGIAPGQISAHSNGAALISAAIRAFGRIMGHSNGVAAPTGTIHNSTFTGYYWYVAATGGSNGNTGSINSPFATIAYANTRASAGDIIVVKAGTHTVSSQVSLKRGVSLEGEGVNNSIINCSVSGDHTFLLYDGSIQDGSQHIANIRFDGAYPTNHTYPTSGTFGAIRVYGRSNVEISLCTISNFLNSGIEYMGQDWGNTVPTSYPTGNKIHHCTFLNCSDYYWPSSDHSNKDYGDGRAAIRFDSQDGMLIYNNTIDCTQRSAEHTGTCIKGVTGWNKNFKIYNNTMSKTTTDGSVYGFAIELWNGRGGNEIYGNTILGGGVDISGGGKNIKGSSTYSHWIHDNSIGNTVLNTSDAASGIWLETNQDSVLIERNHIFNMNKGIYSPEYPDWLDTTSTLSNICIRYNIIENIGAYGIVIAIDASEVSYVNGYSVYNNVITGAAGSESGIGHTGTLLGTSTGFHIRNNIITGFSNCIDLFSSTSSQIQNNIFYNNGNNTPTAPGSFTINGNLTTQPPFVSSSDFHLTAARNGLTIADGAFLSSNTTDYALISLSSPPDIGAYEYVIATSPIRATVQDSSSVSGTLKGKGKLSKTVTGSTVITGVIRNGVSVCPITGHPYGVSSTAGLLRGKGGIKGLVLPKGFVNGILYNHGTMAGRPAGYSLLRGNLKGCGRGSLRGKIGVEQTYVIQGANEITVII